jgi:hypothetical protein
LSAARAPKTMRGSRAWPRPRRRMSRSHLRSSTRATIKMLLAYRRGVEGGSGSVGPADRAHRRRRGRDRPPRLTCPRSERQSQSPWLRPSRGRGDPGPVRALLIHPGGERFCGEGSGSSLPCPDPLRVALGSPAEADLVASAGDSVEPTLQATSDIAHKANDPSHNHQRDQ